MSDRTTPGQVLRDIERSAPALSSEVTTERWFEIVAERFLAAWPPMRPVNDLREHPDLCVKGGLNVLILRAELETMRAERDEWRNKAMDAGNHPAVKVLLVERDEARAESARYRAALERIRAYRAVSGSSLLDPRPTTDNPSRAYLQGREQAADELAKIAAVALEGQ